MIKLKNPTLPRLPSEYQEVEYLESTGTQHIDTEVVPNIANDTRVVAKYSYTEVERYRMLCGCDLGAGFLFGMLNYSSYFTIWCKNETSAHLLPIAGTVYEIDETYKNGKQTFIINGETKATSTHSYNYDVASMYIFKRNTTGDDALPTKLKLYALKIYDNSTLLRDFVPCYRKNDNEAGLYDLANNVFYTNKGTGEFLVGGDVGIVEKDINICPIINGRKLLKRYIGNKLIYPKTTIEFTTCPFPTTWVNIDNLNYFATNSYGEWKITSSSYITSSGKTYTVNLAFDGDTNTYWESSSLASDSGESVIQIDCPILIKPNTIYYKIGYTGNSTNRTKIEGYNIETDSWESFISIANGVPSYEKTIEVTKDNYYSKFRIINYRYNSTYKKPGVYEFQITSGTIREVI